MVDYKSKGSLKRSTGFIHEYHFTGSDLDGNVSQKCIKVKESYTLSRNTKGSESIETV